MIILATLIIVWILVSLLFDLNASFLPTPQGMFREIASPEFLLASLKHIGITLIRTGASVMIGAGLGIPLGLLMAQFTWAKRLLLPPVDFLRSIPTSLLFPVFIVFVGVGELSKVSIALYATLPVFAISAFAGAKPRSETSGRYAYLRVHAMTISNWHVLVSRLWDAIPSLIGGIRLAVSIAIVLVIVTEMFFVSSSGVGWAAYQAYLNFDIEKMYFYIGVIGLIGYAFNTMMDRLTKRITEL